MLRKVTIALSLIVAVGNATAHEVSVDSKFTAKEEVAGVDFPPYPLETYYGGEVGKAFVNSGCYISQDKFRNFSVGEFLELRSIEQQEKLVCAVILLSNGPKRLLASGGAKPNPTELQNLTITTLLLADALRAPYNLSAVEAISATMLVSGVIGPTRRRALMRAIAE